MSFSGKASNNENQSVEGKQVNSSPLAGCFHEEYDSGVSALRNPSGGISNNPFSSLPNLLHKDSHSLITQTDVIERSVVNPITWRFPHSASFVRYATVTCGVIVVVAGGRYVTAVPLSTLGKSTTVSERLISSLCQSNEEFATSSFRSPITITALTKGMINCLATEVYANGEILLGAVGSSCGTISLFSLQAYQSTSSNENFDDSGSRTHNSSRKANLATIQWNMTVLREISLYYFNNVIHTAPILETDVIRFVEIGNDITAIPEFLVVSTENIVMILSLYNLWNERFGVKSGEAGSNPMQSSHYSYDKKVLEENQASVKPKHQHCRSSLDHNLDGIEFKWSISLSPGEIVRLLPLCREGVPLSRVVALLVVMNTGRVYAVGRFLKSSSFISSPNGSVNHFSTHVTACFTDNILKWSDYCYDLIPNVFVDSKFIEKEEIVDFESHEIIVSDADWYPQDCGLSSPGVKSSCNNEDLDQLSILIAMVGVDHSSSTPRAWWAQIQMYLVLVSSDETASTDALYWAWAHGNSIKDSISNCCYPFSKIRYVSRGIFICQCETEWMQMRSLAASFSEPVCYNNNHFNKCKIERMNRVDELANNLFSSRRVDENEKIKASSWRGCSSKALFQWKNFELYAEDLCFFPIDVSRRSSRGLSHVTMSGHDIYQTNDDQYLRIENGIDSPSSMGVLYKLFFSVGYTLFIWDIVL